MDLYLLGRISEDVWLQMKQGIVKEDKVQIQRKDIDEKRLWIETEYQELLVTVYHIRSYTETTNNELLKARYIALYIDPIKEEFLKSWKFLYASINPVDNIKMKIFYIIPKGKCINWLYPYTFMQPVPIQWINDEYEFFRNQAFLYEKEYFNEK